MASSWIRILNTPTDDYYSWKHYLEQPARLRERAALCVEDCDLNVCILYETYVCVALKNYYIFLGIPLTGGGAKTSCHQSTTDGRALHPPPSTLSVQHTKTSPPPHHPVTHREQHDAYQQRFNAIVYHSFSPKRILQAHPSGMNAGDT